MRIILSPDFDEIVINAGRAFGKDLTVGAVLSHLCITKPKTRILFITPFYSQVESFWDQVMEGVDDDTGENFVPQLFKINKNKKEVRFFNGSVIICMSAENAKAIRSKRASWIVVNEAAFISDSIINKELRAVRKKNRGKVIYISTPNGKNWFFNKFIEGMRDESHENYTPAALKPKVYSIYATFKDNPKSSLDVEDMRANTPEKIFDQEVLAKFLDDSAVFSNLNAAFYTIKMDAYASKWIGEEPLKQDLTKGTPQGRYFIGADFAKLKDFTVFTVLDHNGKLVYWERFNKVNYVVQAKRLLELAHHYNDAYVIYDATGVGVSVADNLATERMKPEYSKILLHGVTFTNEVKQELIQTLAIRIQKLEQPEEAFLPSIPQLLKEMRILSVTVSKTGQPVYNAPAGENDDCVFSLALANFACENNRQAPTIFSVKDFYKKK